MHALIFEDVLSIQKQVHTFILEHKQIFHEKKVDDRVIKGIRVSDKFTTEDWGSLSFRKQMYALIFEH